MSQRSWTVVRSRVDQKIEHAGAGRESKPENLPAEG
jgi:hypothetical protein